MQRFTNGISSKVSNVELMKISEFESKLNEWGHEQVPFLFLVDFEMEKPMAWKLDEVPNEILFSINDSTPSLPKRAGVRPELKKHPISITEYKSKFDLVKKRISFGDSYLSNLTVKTKIDLNQSLDELYFKTSAKYKVYWKNEFLVFSPETFVRIENGKILSYPMKGTIDASVPNAEQVILNDKKELAEHVTIVDLIRNDLSTVASEVKVKRFRYVEKIRTNQKDLLQVSSEIVASC